MLELLITTIIPLPPFCTHPKERRERCLMSTYWKSVGPSLSFKSLLLLRHDRHHSLIHTTSLWDKLNNNAPENFCTSSTEFVHPPSPAASPPETEALHGGAGDGEAWGRGPWDWQRQEPENDALHLHCGRLLRGTTLQGSLSCCFPPFNQASYKAVISLFKYSPVKCSHIHNLMTSIMHISEESTWHCLAGA